VEMALRERKEVTVVEGGEREEGERGCIVLRARKGVRRSSRERLRGLVFLLMWERGRKLVTVYHCSWGPLSRKKFSILISVREGKEKKRRKGPVIFSMRGRRKDRIDGRELGEGARLHVREAG